jgi:hypothetical protein
MKSFFLILSFFLTITTLFAQPVGWQEKVKWSFKIEKIDDTHANIVGTAKLLDGWHIFSVDHDPEKADFTGIPNTSHPLFSDTSALSVQCLRSYYGICCVTGDSEYTKHPGIPPYALMESCALASRFKDASAVLTGVV